MTTALATQDDITAAILEMDRQDEDQIIAEIQGRSIDSFVYIARGQAPALTYAGVVEVCNRLNKGGQARIYITDREPKVTETEGFVEVWVYGKDDLNGGAFWGAARQDKPDAKVLEKALGKAQRNALRKLIPEHLAAEMMKAFVEARQTKTIEPRVRQEPRQQRQQSQPPAQKPKPVEVAEVNEAIDGDVNQRTPTIVTAMSDFSKSLPNLDWDTPADKNEIERLRAVYYFAIHGEKWDTEHLQNEDNKAKVHRLSDLLEAIFDDDTSTFTNLSKNRATLLARWTARKGFGKEVRDVLAWADKRSAAATPDQGL